jgi:endonuclease/exonuclease/phosphatase family metal-dependent hydrolase
MAGSVCVRQRREAARQIATIAFALGLASTAGAQTLTLKDAADATLRGGSYANKNLSSGSVLETRASDDAEYKRRVLLKFDTHTTIPMGATVTSATLTMTVYGGNAATRTLSAYRETESYTETSATWNDRRSGTRWSTPGGTMAERVAQATVTATRGSRVTFDVTAMVRNVVKGTYDASSRYARFVVTDAGSSSRDSWRQYYSEDSGSNGPTLTIVLGSASATPPPPPPPPPPSSPSPSPTGSTLKVFHWNIHHGVGTDGVYNLSRFVTWINTSGANVVSLNEVERFSGAWGNEDQPARFAALLKSLTGKTWYYHFAQIYGNATGQGNLILTTYPITSTASYELSGARSVSRVSITVNGRIINMFSTHLDDGSSSMRATQMSQLKSWMTNFAEQRIVAGDFNTWPSQGEITRMTSSYYDAWAVAAAAGTDVSFTGNNGETRNTRIDYIFYSRGASYLVLKQARVFDTRTSSGVMPSDHRPLMATFEVR